MDENTAKAIGIDLSISTKRAIEVCAFVRGKPIQKVKGLLKAVIEEKMAVPFRKFTEGAGHKKGIGPGKYPIKTCREILKMVELAEANAADKGLNTEHLIVKIIKADKGSRPLHYGRKRGRKMKRSRVEVIVEEIETKKEKPKEKKVEKKEVKEEKPKEEKKPVEKEIKKEEVKAEKK